MVSSDWNGGSSLRPEGVVAAAEGPPDSFMNDDVRMFTASSSDSANVKKRLQDQIQRQQQERGGQHEEDASETTSSGNETTRTKQAIEAFHLFRYWCGTIINDDRVQFFIVSLIAINAIMMGIGTFEFVTENPNVDRAFEMIDQIFLIIFTIELAMQAIYHSWKMLLDGWLVFDLVIIVTSWSFSQVQIIRAFRIFRALRLITRIKVMKNLVLGKWEMVLC
jgi:hypothetical protein